MSSTGERNGTKFIWRIENFHCLKEEMLPSPVFNAHSLRWIVEISTSLLKDTEMINVCLHGCSNPKIIVDFSLAFLDCHGLPLIWKEKKNFTFDRLLDPLQEASFNNFIEKSDVFASRKSKFLPNNTLTVQCLIWQTLDELVLPSKCFARTRIEPQAVGVSESFLRNVENVSCFTGSQLIAEKIGFNFDSLKVNLYFDSEDELQVGFHSSLFRISLKVKISVLAVTGEKYQLLNEEIQFMEKETQNRMLNLTKTMLMLYKNMLLHQDTLFLLFTCSVSTKFTFHSMVEKYDFLIDNLPETLSSIPEAYNCDTDQPEDKEQSGLLHSDTFQQNLHDMYEEGFLSDCVLKVGSREFRVHKAVLGARSRFFRDMFTKSMKEKDANCVDLKDIDAVTLQRLLRFIYLDKIEEHVGWESALKLYAAADMYALESLQRKCSRILVSRLCVSNVLEVLNLAVAHQDEDLKSAAMVFISSYDSDTKRKPNQIC